MRRLRAPTEEGATLTLQVVEYACDGVQLTSHLALPAGGSDLPAVLVAHESSGMNDNIQSRALALAERGYAAFALDMYGVDGFSRAESDGLLTRLMETPGLLVSRAKAALATLAAQPSVDPSRIGAIGFCLGGIVALELARAGSPIKCAVGFHPGYVRPPGSSEGPISAKVLLLSGSADPFATEDLRAQFAAEMTSKGADWQLHLFGGVGHTFTDPAIDALELPGFGYDADADRRSWAMMLAFLEECLAPPQ